MAFDVKLTLAEITKVTNKTLCIQTACIFSQARTFGERSLLLCERLVSVILNTISELLFRCSQVIDSNKREKDGNSSDEID